MEKTLLVELVRHNTPDWTVRRSMMAMVTMPSVEHLKSSIHVSEAHHKSAREEFDKAIQLSKQIAAMPEAEYLAYEEQRLNSQIGE